MTIALRDARRWQFGVGVACLAVLYVLLSAKEFTASVLGTSSEMRSLHRAVLLSPGNADYRHRLGRYFAFVAGDPQSAVENFLAAVDLNPHDAHNWLDLAAAYQVTGDITGQRAALDRALIAEPTAPDVAWEAANFFLIDNNIDRALREFRVVIENDNSLAGPALNACWRVHPDVDSLLRDAVPAQTDSLIAFLTLLRGQHETDGAIKTWNRLIDLHEKFPNRYLYEFVQYLIEQHRPEAAMLAWERSAEVLGLASYLPNEDNLVINGDFSMEILNGGFDWNYVNRVGVKPLLDPSIFEKGSRSLSLTFEGPGISDAGIEQVIPVRPKTTYEFSAYYKTADFEGAGGPEIVLRDAYSGAPLYASDPLTDADFWKEVHSKVTTPDSTTLLVLRIERFPAGSPIRGKLWLDNFELSPNTGTDSSSEPEKDKS